MLIDRHQQMNLFESILPASTVQMDAELEQINALLDNDGLFETIKADLAKRYPKTTTRGRHSTPVEVILRMLIVKHLYNWSFEETEHFVNDSLSLRQFCRIYLETVPDDTVLIRWARLISNQTLKRLHEHLVREATRRKITRGRKLRIDTTVVETNIHYPTDSTLLQDGLRVLARTVKKAKALVPSMPDSLVRDFTRSAQRQVLRIVKFSKGSSDEATTTVKGAYQRLCETARRAVTAAQKVKNALSKKRSHVARNLIETLQSVVPLVEEVIDQTRRRVVHGQKVPAEQKLVSIFEPTTSIHRRGKRARPTEFGHLLKLQETDGGIITHVDLLFSPTNDATLLEPSLK
ncbi:MAG: ISNCY family transposase, partial [Bacteroidota bacterium]